MTLEAYRLRSATIAPAIFLALRSRVSALADHRSVNLYEPPSSPFSCVRTEKSERVGGCCRKSLTALSGIVLAFSGFSDLETAINMPASAVLVAWAIALGVLMSRLDQKPSGYPEASLPVRPHGIAAMASRRVQH